MEKDFKSLYSLPPYNFLGIEDFCDFKNSKFVVIPIPFGNNAPIEIIKASREIELFDLVLKEEPYKKGIFTMQEIEPIYNDSKKTVERIEEVLKDIIEKNKIPILIGGVHTVTLASALAFPKDVCFIIFDAHADLRDEYEGSKINFACVARRIFEVNKNLIEIGIRSISKEEFEFVNANKIKVYLKQEIEKNGLEKITKDIIKEISEKKVYLSIDFDCLDPSIAPGVRWPEPNGLNWNEILFILKEITKNSKVVGFDLVEVSLTPGNNVTEALAARLIYKMIGMTS
jgi:agmatinase